MYITCPWLIYFIPGNVYLLTTFANFAIDPTLYLWEPPVISLYLWRYVVCFFFSSTYLWDHTVFFFLCLTCFITLMPSRTIHVLERQDFLLFYSWRVITSMHTLPLQFLFHSLIIGYGSCFRVFNNVHNTSMNMGRIYLFKLPFHLL